MKSRFKLLAALFPMFAMILAGCGSKPQTTKPEEQQQQQVHVTGVSVNPTTLTLDVDETANLTATVAPANADNKNVVWTSDDETVATVSSTGVVTAVFEGETQVHAKTVDGNFDAYCTVTVNEIVIPHYCTHVCPTCGLCLDPTCQDPVCATKCEGHVPTKAFSNGKLILEAEDGDVTGTMTGTEVGDKFIAQRNSDNPDHPTSGNIVMNWAAEGNKITWKFKLDEAEPKVAFKLWVACGGSQNSANLKFTVNGTQASWDQGSVEGKGFSENKWYYWSPLTTKGPLVQGVNTIVLENLTTDSWNIDCLELQNHYCDHICPVCGGCLDADCQDPLCATKCEGHNHTCEHVCEFCEKCTDSQCQDAVCAQKCPGHNVVEFTNGKYRIPNSNDFGTYEVYAREAVTIRLEFKANFTSTDSNNDNNASDIRVNGSKSSTDKANHGTSDGHAFPGWTIYTSNGTWDLVKGKNTITFSEPWQSHVTYEWIDIVDSATPVHTCSHVCETCTKCTDIQCIYYQCASNRCQGHNHECQHVCEYCEKCTDSACLDPKCGNKCPGHNVVEASKLPLRVEFENFNAQSGTVNVANEQENEGLSGAKYIGDFNYLNSSAVTYDVYAKEAVSTSMVVKYATGINGNDNGAFEFYLNETKVGNFGELSDWHSWKTVTINNLNLVQGKNTFKFAAPYGSYTNLDYFEIDLAIHECSHVCPICGGCLDADCQDPLCATKCEGHAHECGHVCEFCGKCTDTECQDVVCSQKCAGHNVIEFTNGKYRIPSASAAGTYKVCAHEAVTVRLEFKANFTSTNNNNDNNAVEIWVNEQRASNNKVNFGTSDGHAFPGPTIYTTSGTWNLDKGENTIRIVVPTDTNATYEWFDIVDSATPVHTCSHICETCSKCTDVQCIYYQCASNRCEGHNHECQHVCQYCNKCTDETCLDPACGQKCAGHNILDLSSGSMIFESENGYDFVNCSAYTNANASNNGGVGGDWTNGSSYKFDFIVTEEVQVKLTACGALFSENPANQNGVCSAKIDGTGYANFGCGTLNGANENYHVYNEYASDKVVTLSAGQHTILVEGCYGSIGNMDYIKIVKHTPAAPEPEVQTKTVRLEAEYAVRSSDKLEVLSRLSDTDHATSNGLCVGGFSNDGADNAALTFNFNSDKAGVYKMTVWEANCTGLTTFDSAFTVKVNGVTVTASEGTMSACDYAHWYLFQSVKYVDLTLVEGANKIEFINTAKYGINIDCIDLEVLEDTTISTPNIARLEAEEGTIKGTIVGNTQYPTHTYAGDTAFKNVNEKDSGGASIGNWASNGDNNFKGYFSVDKDTQVYVVIYVSFASMGELDLLNRFWGIGVDGCIEMTKVTTTANNSIVTDDTYHDWRAIMIAVPYEVTAGQEHYICVDSKQGCGVNFDCFDIIAVDPTVVVTPIGVPSQN